MIIFNRVINSFMLKLINKEVHVMKKGTIQAVHDEDLKE